MKLRTHEQTHKLAGQIADKMKAEDAEFGGRFEDVITVIQVADDIHAEECVEKLVALAITVGHRIRTEEQLRALMEKPEFEDTGKVHDWRNYIDDGIADLWDKLSLDARIVLWMHAERRADAEEWD